MSFGQYSAQSSGSPVHPYSIEVKSETNKRVKHVFSSDEIYHLWAHGKDSQGIRSNGASVSADNGIFYSYSTAVAARTIDASGKVAYLVSSDRYSVTTAKHIGYVHRAIPSSNVFRVPTSRGYDGRDILDHKHNVSQMADAVRETVKDALESRNPKRDRLLGEATSAYRYLKAYALAFGVSADVPDIKTSFTAEEHETFRKDRIKAAREAKAEAARNYRARIQAWMDAHPTYKTRWDGTNENAESLAAEFNKTETARKVAEREAQRMAAVSDWMSEHPEIASQWDGTREDGDNLRAAWERANRERGQAENVAKWLSGGIVPTYNLPYSPTLLRVKGDMVETSRGADFPVSHAVRGLTLVRAVMARGEEWHTNGHTCRLGHYQIDRITSDGTVYAGCHVVPYASIERIADALEASRTAHNQPAPAPVEA